MAANKDDVLPSGEDFINLAPNDLPIALTTPAERARLRKRAWEAFQWSSRNPRARQERGQFMARLHRRWLADLGYSSASTDELQMLVANSDTSPKLVSLAARLLNRRRAHAHG